MFLIESINLAPISLAHNAENSARLRPVSLRKIINDFFGENARDEVKIPFRGVRAEFPAFDDVLRIGAILFRYI